MISTFCIWHKSHKIYILAKILEKKYKNGHFAIIFVKNKLYNLKLVGINHHTYKIIQNLSLSLLRAITIEIEIKERSKEIIPKMLQGRK